MTTTSHAQAASDAGTLHVACPNCATLNRVPVPRLGAGRCGRCKQALFGARPIALTATTFDAHATRSDIPLLVDFWASWCAPCRVMAPVFESAARELEPGFRLAKVDTDSEPQLAARFGVRSIPTLLIVRHGKELARRTGAMEIRQLVQWARQHR